MAQIPNCGVKYNVDKEKLLLAFLDHGIASCFRYWKSLYVYPLPSEIQYLAHTASTVQYQLEVDGKRLKVTFDLDTAYTSSRAAKEVRIKSTGGQWWVLDFNLSPYETFNGVLPIDYMVTDRKEEKQNGNMD